MESPICQLVGSDYYWDLITGSTCKIEGGPTAVHTKLGCVLSGPIAADHSLTCVNLVTTHLLRADTPPLETTHLEEQLQSFWELESLGIYEEEKTLYDDLYYRPCTHRLSTSILQKFTRLLVTIYQSSVTSAKCSISQLIKFNSLTALLRVTAQVLRAVQKHSRATSLVLNRPSLETRSPLLKFWG